MKKEEYFAIKQRVTRYLHKKLGITDVATIEDITHDVILHRTRYPKRSTQTIEQSIIDCSRESLGRKGGPYYDLRRNLNRTSKFGEEIERIKDRSNSERSKRHREDIKRLTRSLCQKDKIIIGLITEWGFSGREVANLFGVTESRISQEYKRIQSCLSERVTKKKQETTSKRKRKVGILLSEKENGRSGVEQPKAKGMEKEKSRESEVHKQESIPEWGSF